MLSGVLALATMLASPVAGVFLMLGALAKLLADGRPAWRTAAWLGLPAIAGGIGLYLLFPEGGTDRFTATAFWPMLADLRRGRRVPGPGTPDPVGGRPAVPDRARGRLRRPVAVRAERAPARRAGRAVRADARAPQARARASRWPSSASRLLYLQWLPAVRAVAEAHGDPSTRLAFQAEARDFLTNVVKPGERVEVPMTVNHWEAADLAKVVPLARGWERQLDQKANPIFYDGDRVTASRYHDWLRENAVRWVALPNAPLDYSARDEAVVLERGAKFLELAYESPRWRIWEVRGTDPAGLRRREAARRGPELVHGRRRAHDRRPLPLHEVLVHERRLPEPRARRLDAGRTARRRRRAGPGALRTGASPPRKGVLAPVEAKRPHG